MRPAPGILLLAAALLAFGCNSGRGGSGDDGGDNANQNLALCGNGQVDPGEECDDGALNSDDTPDSCRTSCRSAFCADEVIDSGEECDGSGLGGADCLSLGFATGEASCSSTCGLDASGCSGWIAISAGQSHTCAARPDGTVRCWGRNTLGQLGSSAPLSTSAPLEVAGVIDAVAITAGADHACVLLGDGAATCWGRNDLGQLGDGTTGVAAGPVTVTGLSDVVALDSYAHHTCALDGSGAIWCWGAGGSGQLGDGGLGDSAVPVQVNTPSSMTAVAAGGQHSCAIDDTAGAWCWGRNDRHQLGDGSDVDSASPVAVQNATTAVAIGAGDNHSCGLQSDGTGACWGDNTFGQLGRPTAPVFFGDPGPITTLTGATAIVGGEFFTCARNDEGRAACWGRNSAGVLGDGSAVDVSVPTVVVDLSTVAQIAPSLHHTCALLDDASARCWGYNGDGELGAGVARDGDLPIPLATLGGVQTLGMGAEHSCAISQTTGAILCWGSNQFGQLGDGSIEDRLLPATVFGLVGATSVSAGLSFTCAVNPLGEVGCWGRNGRGQLGNGTFVASLLPAMALTPPNVTKVVAGLAHACALTLGGTIGCWGDNRQGQVGNGASSLLPQEIPGAVVGVTNAVAVATQLNHTCGIDTLGNVACWGAGGVGQLGDGTNSDSGIPVPVQGLPGPAAVVAPGGFHTCAGLQDQTAWCWGSNSEGQLGDGTLGDRLSPVQVLDETGAGPLGNLIQLASGLRHSCATDDAGSVWCWGNNRRGQLGTGTSERSTLAVRFDIPGFAIRVALGHNVTCVLLDDRKVWCAGSNHTGQLGVGTRAASYEPAAIIEE